MGDDHAIETYKSLVSLSAQALKQLQLLNGGAVVALLAYLGQISNRAEVAVAVIWPLVLFISGLVFSTVANFGAYFVQLARFNYAVEPTDRLARRESRWLTITIVLASLSLIAFGVGAVLAAMAFSQSA